MAKVKLARLSSTAAAVADNSNTPALLSLVFGALGWLLLPVIGAMVAIVAGHIGRNRARHGAPRGGMALAGLVLGYVWWLLLIPIMGMVMVPAYQDYVQRRQAEVVQGETAVRAQDAAANHSPAEALDMAKMWVAARWSTGTPLNEVVDTLNLSPAQQQYWRQISIQQGTIRAIPANDFAGEPLVLLSVQKGDRLVWACAGRVPDMAKTVCAQQ